MWKTISDFPNYSVSDFGAVIRNKTGKVLSLSKNVHGYCVVSLGYGNTRLVHRLVAEEFLNNSNPLRVEVAHNNGIPDDNRVSNLRWATKAENQLDRIAHGTHMRGERAAYAKFSNKEAAELRKVICSSSNSNVEIARIYGVSHETIRSLRKGLTYKDAII